MTEFKFTSAREALIFEMGVISGMMKREQEISQEIANYEYLYDLRHQDASSGIRLKLHTDKWFKGMNKLVNDTINILENKNHTGGKFVK